MLLQRVEAQCLQYISATRFLLISKVTMKPTRATTYQISKRCNDDVDDHLILDSDSTDRRTVFSSPSARSRSGISAATQTEDDDGRWFSCLSKVMFQRAVMVIAAILVLLAIMLLERCIGVDIVDERKLIQDIATQLIPSGSNGLAPAAQAQTISTE